MELKEYGGVIGSWWKRIMHRERERESDENNEEGGKK